MINNPSPKRNVYPKGQRRRLRARYFLLMVVALAVLCVSRPGPLPKAQVDMSPGLKTPAAPQSPALDAGPPEPQMTVEEKRVRRGDTLYDILRGCGLSDTQILAVSSRKVDGINPSHLVAGRRYRLCSVDGRLVEYQYEPDDVKVLKAAFGSGDPVVTVENIPYDVFRMAVSGVIEDSLFAAVDAIGEKPALAMELADLFAWQVDFFRDLRKGDTFTVLVDKYFRGGEFVRYGKILAARFVNDGTTHTGILFKPSGGREDYFDETGGSLRKQFLKSPLRFRRISSGFSRRRLHPVTGKMTAHLGIDYAAPIGTPVMAIGDGKVIFRKHDPINGRIVKIRHNGTYSTAYAHLNSFAKGIAGGSRVRQGQVIGYVGKSGRATGPHLHFAMYKNGRYANPRSISVPRASSVPDADRAAFDHRMKEIALELERGPHEQVAGGGD